MKKKIMPEYYNSKSLEELTLKASKAIEELEKTKDLKDSIDSYQELMKLNSIIEKKFSIKSSEITQNIKKKISTIKKKRNAK